MSSSLTQRWQILRDIASDIYAGAATDYGDALTHISRENNLSVPMVNWALRTTFRSLSESELETLLPEEVRKSEANFVRSLAIISAQNVFTAWIPQAFYGLLVGSSVQLRPARDAACFALWMREQIARKDARLGGALQIVSFDSSDRDALESLIDDVELLHVFGSDQTISAVKLALPPEKLFRGHGHGVGAAFIDQNSFYDSAVLEKTMQQLALDVCAYDQRGCLSPQCIFLETRDIAVLKKVALILDQALTELDHKLPRGPLSYEDLAAEATWRATGVACGELIASEEHALSLEDHGRFRTSSGFRNLSLVTTPSVDTARLELQSLGQHLKCIGLPAQSFECLKEKFAFGGAWTTPIGSMQTPPIYTPLEGVPPWENLVLDAPPIKRQEIVAAQSFDRSSLQRF